MTHEAPSCHPNGFAVIDNLAHAMNVKMTFHGHHHEDIKYDDIGLGYEAFGVGLRSWIECRLKNRNSPH